MTAEIHLIIPEALFCCPFKLVKGAFLVIAYRTEAVPFIAEIALGILPLAEILIIELIILKGLFHICEIHRNT